MRYLIIIALFLAGCQGNPKTHTDCLTEKEGDSLVVAQRDWMTRQVDTIHLIADSAKTRCDSAQYFIDSVKAVNDTLARKLLYSKLKLRNIKYYVDICNRNRSQSKFLLGWMNRALAE